MNHITRYYALLAVLGYGVSLDGATPPDPTPGTVSQATATAPQSGRTNLSLSALSAVPAGNTVTITNPSTSAVPIEYQA